MHLALVNYTLIHTVSVVTTVAKIFSCQILPLVSLWNWPHLVTQFAKTESKMLIRYRRKRRTLTEVLHIPALETTNYARRTLLREKFLHWKKGWVGPVIFKTRPDAQSIFPLVPHSSSKYFQREGVKGESGMEPRCILRSLSTFSWW